ncbi:MAG: translational GTPase TypA, partial [Chloroflexales bacterium]|nr:translational GTPase TypA [Chloroflexales bacterium]
LGRKNIDEVAAGDIVALIGLESVDISDSICDPENPQPLEAQEIEPPTLTMMFSVNDSPFAGREGKYVTSRNLRERLFKELESNVALKVEESDAKDAFKVSGRGLLHLGILIENMRREGYEFQVSKPEVIFKQVDGVTVEPMELVEIEVGEDYQGAVVEMLGRRRGTMRDMHYRDDGSVHYVYHVATRALLGFRQQLLSSTRGQAVMNSLFAGYEPLVGEFEHRTLGSLIAWEPGIATTFGLHSAQERGRLFVPAGIEVYEGMVVGQHIRPPDLEVNVCKKKHLTNMRNSGGEDSLQLDSPRQLSLDDAIEYIADDELVEVTPKSFRIRKKTLASDDRRREQKRRDMALA